MTNTAEKLTQPVDQAGRSRAPHLGPGGAELAKDATRQARRVAAMVLEVLAGARTPTEAAQALELSVPRYYQLETRAVHGLLAACELAPKGRQRSTSVELAALRRDKERLEREVLRQQALVRAAQRTVGLPPPAPVKKTGKKMRPRRLARALHVAGRLHQDSPQQAAAAAAAATS
jgi:hypothetical protein